jgi:hypothetical protein
MEIKEETKFWLGVHKRSFIKSNEGYWRNEIMAIISVPKGTSLKLTDKQMTWDDEPFKLE